MSQEQKSKEEAKGASPMLPTAAKRARSDENGSQEAETRDERRHAHSAVPEGPGKILEKGLIYFFYRPRLDVSEAHDLSDVQRLYILLSPNVFETDTMKTREHKKRLIVVGRKKLPPITDAGHPHSRSMSWCYVDLVSHHFEKIDAALGPDTVTLLQGNDTVQRQAEPARPVAEGVYAIFDYPRHTHLAYVLELPKDLGEVQEAFNIEREGSYVISAKNPKAAGAPGSSMNTRPAPVLPGYLEERFEGRAWNKVSPTDFLDHEGLELLLIGASKSVEEDLGSLGRELKELERLDAKGLSENKLFQELKLSRATNPPEPLLKGTWK